MKNDTGYLRSVEGQYIGEATVALVDYEIAGEVKTSPKSGAKYFALTFSVKRERVPGEDDE